MKLVVKLVSVLVLGLFTAPPFAEAQQSGKVWRIGYLAVAPNPDIDDAFLGPERAGFAQYEVNRWGHCTPR